MSIMDSIRNLFKPKPLTKEEYEAKVGLVETKRAQIQLRLARERDKSDPDPLKIDRYEREIVHWGLLLKKLKEQSEKIIYQ